MKLRYPVIVASVVAIATGSALVYRDTHTIVPYSPGKATVIEEAAPLKSDAEQAVDTTTQEETVSPEVPPAEDSNVAPEPVSLPDKAKTRILADTNNITQYDCFYKIIDYRYGWNVSETEMFHRIDTVEQTYSSFCSAWSVIQTYPLNAPLAPPGFRD